LPRDASRSVGSLTDGDYSASLRFGPRSWQAGLVDRSTYRERLLPQWWVWVFVVALVTMLAVAYGAALGTGPGFAVAIPGVLVGAWLLWISSPVVAVDDQGLSAAGARLPQQSIGDVEIVDKATIRALRGPGADARMYVVLRPWSASSAVLVNLDDADDPHPAWLVSTRNPARLCESIRSVHG
jgi:hypothetical protein